MKLKKKIKSFKKRLEDNKKENWSRGESGGREKEIRQSGLLEVMRACPKAVGMETDS